MIPDAGQPRPSSSDRKNPEDSGETSKQPELPESAASATTDSGAVKVSHRTARPAKASSHLGASGKVSFDTSLSRLELQLKLMGALYLYKNEKPAKGETQQAFIERLSIIHFYQSELALGNIDINLTSFQKLEQTKSANIGCTLLLSAAMTKLKLNDRRGLMELTNRLLDNYADVLPDFIELLNLNHEYNFNPTAFEDEDKLTFFCELAKKSHFMPSIWLMTKLALKPGGPISPGLIIDLLASLEATDKLHGLVLSAFVLSPDDVEAVIELDRPHNRTEYHQALWIFACLFNLSDKDYWPGNPGGFPEKLQKSLASCLRQSVLETRDKMFTQVMEEVKSLEQIDEEKDKQRLLRIEGQLKSLYGVEDTKAAERDSELSSYQRDISGLILAWHTRQRFIQREANPLQCASILRRIGRRENFKLVYMDAAKIFASFGHYDKALECLAELLSNPLPSGHRKMVMHQYESYSLARQAAVFSKTTSSTTDENEWLVGTGATGQTGARKKNTSKGKGKKGKGKGKRTKDTRPAQKTEKSKESHSEAVEGSSQLPVPEATTHEMGRKQTANVTEVSQPEQPSTSAVPEVSAPISSEKEPKARKSFHPEGGWLPDGHREVSIFQRDIHLARDNCDLKLEAKTISRWLNNTRGQPVYGRICEEAAWFYIRQMESPFPNLYALDGETVSKRTDMAKLAEQWLSRTEACYFQTPRSIGNNPDELRELIVSTYASHPDWQQNSEYRKRIRGICSSRGHLYSNLSAYTSGGQYSWSHHQKLTDRYRAFYHLKELADPEFELINANFSGMQL
ncbi:hypothetical protein [Endozoicomonas lisbonensis]|uniref:Tetratricopeptide (TPR) repeat protein n=1 Tax=Endozoicomonas lisbonensis TaxID=3120522 RepID=A0ABV2SNX4_9GAMM